MNRLITSTLAVFALATTVGSVNAAEYSRAMPQMTVSYADLDITHAAGAQILLQRINMAANSVCGGRPDVRDLKMQGYYGACFSEAMNGAIAAVQSPLVAELYGNPRLATAAAPQKVAEQATSQGGNLNQKPNLFERLANLF
jgi:UrcA family protein